ncbi:MAG: hypothetical protein ACRDDY_14245 [Clostridium sp.]|uniref:hypothetical protein n=1 Tax=Clostridium sp. TaxID=1506 RepID=UPI003EE6FE80
MKIKINKIILDEINFKKNKNLINSTQNFIVKTKGQIGLPTELEFTESEYIDLLVHSIVTVNSSKEDETKEEYFNLTLKYSIILDLFKEPKDILPLEKINVVNEIGKIIQYEVEKQIKYILDQSDIKEIENK